MEIIVQGKAEDYVSPDQVVLDFTFKVVRKTYELALRDGVENVSRFIDQILSENGFLMENLKTRSFSVRKESHYDPKTQKHIFDGYAFQQNAQLTFDYDKAKLALMMEELSKIEEAPYCHVDFGVKDAKEVRRGILGEAFRDAQSQAEAIAAAAGKNLQYCAKVDFKPFTNDYRAGVDFGADRMMKMADMEGMSRERAVGAAQQIIETFTPEDVRLTETIYCLWVTD